MNYFDELYSFMIFFITHSLILNINELTFRKKKLKLLFESSFMCV